MCLICQDFVCPKFLDCLVSMLPFYSLKIGDDVCCRLLNGYALICLQILLARQWSVTDVLPKLSEKLCDVVYIRKFFRKAAAVVLASPFKVSTGSDTACSSDW